MLLLRRLAVLYKPPHLLHMKDSNRKKLLEKTVGRFDAGRNQVQAPTVTISSTAQTVLPSETEGSAQKEAPDTDGRNTLRTDFISLNLT